MKRFSVRMRALWARSRELLKRARARWAASRLGLRWAALPRRSQRVIAGGGAGVLVLVLVAGLVLGPLSPPTLSRAVNSPSLALAPATASASVLVASMPSATTTLESPGDGFAPSVLARPGYCTPDSEPEPVASGGRLYVSCDSWTKIVAVDLATDTVAKIYTLTYDPTDVDTRFETMVVDQGLWLSTGVGVERIDLTTGAVVALLKGMTLVGDFSGTLLVVDADGNLFHVNPATAKKSAWSAPDMANQLMKLQDGSDDDLDYDVVACGMIWVWGAGSDSIYRLNPADGTVTDMGNAKVQGWPMDIVQLGDTCWAVLQGKSDGLELARLGTSCVDMVTSEFGDNTEAWWVVGNTLWLSVVDPSIKSGDASALAEVEPFGGKIGRIWDLPLLVENAWIIEADGQVWVGNQYGYPGFARVDLPIDVMTPGPTPATLACVPLPAPPSPNVGVSPSPSSSNSASPSLTAAPTAAPTPAPTPSPVGSTSPSPSSDSGQSPSASD